MGSFSIWHWLVVLAIVLVLFGGKGKISNLMGDLAQGVKAFKKGLADEDGTSTAATPTEGPKVLSADAPAKPAAQVETDEAAKH